jgi:hypothetical protein
VSLKMHKSNRLKQGMIPTPASAATTTDLYIEIKQSQKQKDVRNLPNTGHHRANKEIKLI